MSECPKTVFSHIRPAVLSDCASIEKIAKDAFSMYVPRMDREPFPMLDDYKSHIKSGNTYVLEDPDGIQGYIVLIPGNECMMLDTVAVNPNSQKRGYGKRLINFAEQHAREHAFPQIRLYTNEAMHENLSLYPRFGYRESHRAVEKGYKRVFFVKDLGIK